MADRLGDPGVPVWLFWLGSVAFVFGIGAIIWFAIPGIDAKHRFTSPSGRVVLEVGETCGDTECRRIIVSEETAPDGTKARYGCTMPITDQRPVFLNMHPLWADDESSVDLVYADAEGIGGRFTLVLKRDCTVAS